MCICIYRAQVRNKNETQKVSNPLRTTRPMEHLQIDLFDMISYANQNHFYRYVLVVIDCFSKYAWAIPINEKTGANVANSLQNIFFAEGPCQILQSDNGYVEVKQFELFHSDDIFRREFKNVEVKALCDRWHIEQRFGRGTVSCSSLLDVSDTYFVLSEYRPQSQGQVERYL